MIRPLNSTNYYLPFLPLRVLVFVCERSVFWGAFVLLSVFLLSCRFLFVIVS